MKHAPVSSLQPFRLLSLPPGPLLSPLQPQPRTQSTIYRKVRYIYSSPSDTCKEITTRPNILHTAILRFITVVFSYLNEANSLYDILPSNSQHKRQ
jgi:hypothetical protein